ncbi:hypothetical protein ACFL11_01320, partial [Patescibacteria group bacterium]
RIKYGAVLHEHPDRQGECEVFTEDDDDISNGTNPFTGKDNLIGDSTSSVTVFLQNEELGEGGVYFCKDENERDRSSCFGPYQDSGIQKVSDEGIEDNSISSIIIDGNYMAALFEHENYTGVCQIFRESDSNLRNDRLGRCGCLWGELGCDDCLTSFIVVPIK